MSQMTVVVSETGRLRPKVTLNLGARYDLSINANGNNYAVPHVGSVSYRATRIQTDLLENPKSQNPNPKTPSPIRLGSWKLGFGISSIRDRSRDDLPAVVFLDP
jgi:hypothetical protein